MFAQKSPKISVCMATRNGERFIAEQLASILPQLGPDDEVVISDDSSTDRTVAVIRGFGDSRIRLLEGNAFRSPILNFAHAIGAAAGELIVLADQDDVWLPGKIELSVAKMSELARENGPGTPLLVHSDLRVVDESLKPIAPSLWRFQRTAPENAAKLNRELVQNTVSGCTITINRALRDLALPIPAGVVMHDWWLALVAAAFGRIGRVDQPTALYRQHGANDTGARQGSLFSLLRVFSEIGRIRNDLQRIRSQAALFLERYQPMLPHDAAELVEAFARLGERGAFMRRVVIVRYGFYHTGFLRNIGMLLVC